MSAKDPISIRFSEDGDQKNLVEWLLQPGVLQWFPLFDLREIEDAARISISYSRYGAALTALWEGVPCGVANLYLQPYKKMAHQCLFMIIVDEQYRGKGVGTRLLAELAALGKERFQLEFIHLEVYAGNPAIRLYQRLGFEEYGRQRRFIKDGDQYLDKLFMQKVL